jgi:Nucleotide-diphospho-sugar transferase
MSKSYKPVIVTVVYGEFHKYLGGWLRNVRSTGCDSLIHIIVLDKHKLDLKVDARDVEIHRWRTPSLGRWSGDYLRLDLIRDLCAEGHTCLQIDLDTFFNEDPARFCGVDYDFIISRGLGFPEDAIRRWGFSLCTGFYIIKPEARDLLDAWRALRIRDRGLEQESLNMMLLERNVRWCHDRSEWVRDALLVSEERDVCVLPERAVTRDCSFGSFGGVHHPTMLARYA